MAIFGVKSNRFLCMDAGGTIFTSVSIGFNKRHVFLKPHLGLKLFIV